MLEDIMQVDTIAMLQGIFNARDANEISSLLCKELHERISNISTPGKVGRPECDYTSLLEQLGLAACAENVDGVEWIEFSLLWKRLGDSLASGITVAN